MMVIVSYDVSTTTAGGRRRLSRVSKECLNYGLRVQNSVFECQVDPVQYVCLKNKLLNIINDETDSIKFYFLGSNWKNKIECYGCKQVVSVDEPMVL